MLFTTAQHNTGSVRVYDWDGAAWVQVGTDIDGKAEFDNSGWSVALSSNGNRLAIGAPPNDDNGQDSGHVRVYDWDGSTWIQVGTDIAGEAAGDHSGWSVSLSADGSRLAIGARNNDGNGADAGQVRVYIWNGSTWVQIGADIDGEATGDWSGYAVALSAAGSRVAIGAKFNDGNGADAVRYVCLSFNPPVRLTKELGEIKYLDKRNPA
ncbi:MAG: FG-GAP repeat protein [Chitinophagales bacterium]